MPDITVWPVVLVMLAKRVVHDNIVFTGSTGSTDSGLDKTRDELAVFPPDAALGSRERHD